MKIIINHSSMQPIYEQIAEQIKTQIAHGELLREEALPSVRTLAKELKISALTVKKAYDGLEEDGFIVTVHGKGSFISGIGAGLLMETRRREAEAAMEQAVQKARACEMQDAEIREMLELFLEPGL